MRAIRLKNSGGLDNLELVEKVAVEPQCGEIRICNHASSLNFHDYVVAIGLLPVDDGRIPMLDGAGVVEAVGPGVTQCKPGDRVMRCFSTHCTDGWADDLAKLAGVPRVNVDGFAAETVTVGSRAHRQAMVRAINSSGFVPVIDPSFDLGEIAQAFRLRESQQHPGKICLRF